MGDEYFTKRKLYPNVDYYSGIMLRAIGIPTSMFTVMFAMSRVVGWTSQWKEMLAEGQLKICRPRQLYNGVAARKYEKLTTQLQPTLNRANSSIVAGVKRFSTRIAEEESAHGTTTVNGGHKALSKTSFVRRLSMVGSSSK